MEQPEPPALKPAIAEVNQLSRFTVAMRLQKRGRSVVAVELSWEEKSDLAATRSELGRHSAGRTARRAGTVETVVETPQEAVESRKGARQGKSPPKPSKALHEAPRPVLTVDEFPASGGIHFTAWAEVAHAELPGAGTPDIDMVVARFASGRPKRDSAQGAADLAGFRRLLPEMEDPRLGGTGG